MHERARRHACNFRRGQNKLIECKYWKKEGYAPKSRATSLTYSPRCKTFVTDAIQFASPSVCRCFFLPLSTRYVYINFWSKNRCALLLPIHLWLTTVAALAFIMDYIYITISNSPRESISRDARIYIYTQTIYLVSLEESCKRSKSLLHTSARYRATINTTMKAIFHVCITPGLYIENHGDELLTAAAAQCK